MSGGGHSVTLQHKKMTRPDNGGDVRHAADGRVTGLCNEQSEGNRLSARLDAA